MPTFVRPQLRHTDNEYMYIFKSSKNKNVNKQFTSKEIPGVNTEQ